jgi:predicted DNA-binding protein with PD1-like motif
MSPMMIEVAPGQEVMDVVARRLSEQRISNAAIASVVGAVDQCCISTMSAGDAKSDLLTEYTVPCELSGSGEVRNGIPHIHCVLGMAGDETRSGHLHWAKVETFFVNVYVLPLDE